MTAMIARVSRRRFLISLAVLLPVAASAAAVEPTTVASSLQPFIDDGTLAGAVTLVADKDRTLSFEAIGYADIAAGKPMSTDAVFWIASMSKPITGAAFMMLVDEGKVSLDDPVEKYLPEFQGQMVVAERDAKHTLLKKPQHPITIRNILSHTSGLPFRTEIETPTLDILPLSARVRSYAMSPLQFEPDTKYQYANAGINTAGRIIEVVSGMSYADFLDQRLFKPLGMVDTTFSPNAQQIARIATSYKTDGAGKLEATTVSQLQYPLDGPGREPMPAGGLFSTAADVGIFCRMVFNGGELGGRRYLSPEAVKQMTSLQTGDLPNGYGLGWSVDKPPKSSFGHGGAYATNMRIDPEQGIITVFMVQYAGTKSDRWKQVLPTLMDAAAEAYGK